MKQLPGLPSASVHYWDTDIRDFGQTKNAWAIMVRCTSGSCRYLDRAGADLRRRGAVIDEQRLRRLLPLGWDHINLTGDYVWSESATYDADGLRPLNSEPEVLAA